MTRKQLHKNSLLHCLSWSLGPHRHTEDFQMSCGIAPKTAGLDRELHFILGGVRCLKAIRKQLLAARCQRELLQGETFVLCDSPAAYNWGLLKSALMPGYQLVRYSSLHGAQPRTMEKHSIREMLFDAWKMSPLGERTKPWRLWKLALSHRWCNWDLQPLKSFSTLAQLQPIQAFY